jgi:hypothetical protein
MKEEKTKYDRSVTQRVPMKTVVGDEAYEIAFMVDLPSDDEIIKAMAAKDDQPETEVFAPLFKKYVVSAEGCADDLDRPFTKDELAESVPVEDQAFVFSSAMLGVSNVPKPVAKGKKLNWRTKTDTTTHELKTFFNGELVKTRHTLTNPRTKEITKLYEQMEEKRFPAQFGDFTINSIAQGLCVLYRALLVRAEGYTSHNVEEQTVPAHHQMAVAMVHFNGERELLLGK